MAIVYKKGSLFETSKGSILVHSVNAKGIWGKGIAVEFKKRFPESFQFYYELCNEYGANLVGTYIEGPKENEYKVCNLVTSNGYGKFRDSKENILFNTRTAIRFLLEDHLNENINSNMFNSDLFGVPWNDTEKILKEVTDEVGYKSDWTVWKL
jgi:ADP-ribose 1''-phosphate phosphatase